LVVHCQRQPMHLQVVAMPLTQPNGQGGAPSSHLMPFPGCDDGQVWLDHEKQQNHTPSQASQ